MKQFDKLTATERQEIRSQGAAAERILNDAEVMHFLMLTRSDIVEELTDISGFSEEFTNQRLALTYNLSGLERFVGQLRSAVVYKNRIVSEEAKVASGPNL